MTLQLCAFIESELSSMIDLRMSAVIRVSSDVLDWSTGVFAPESRSARFRPVLSAARGAGAGAELLSEGRSQPASDHRPHAAISAELVRGHMAFPICRDPRRYDSGNRAGLRRVRTFTCTPGAEPRGGSAESGHPTPI